MLWVTLHDYLRQLKVTTTLKKNVQMTEDVDQTSTLQHLRHHTRYGQLVHHHHSQIQVYALKVGFAATASSIFILVPSLYNVFGNQGVWAIMTGKVIASTIIR